jgi:hypothetical protein
MGTVRHDEQLETHESIIGRRRASGSVTIEPGERQLASVVVQVLGSVGSSRRHRSMSFLSTFAGGHRQDLWSLEVRPMTATADLDCEGVGRRQRINGQLSGHSSAVAGAAGVVAVGIAVARHWVSFQHGDGHGTVTSRLRVGTRCLARAADSLQLAARPPWRPSGHAAQSTEPTPHRRRPTAGAAAFRQVRMGTRRCHG